MTNFVQFPCVIFTADNILVSTNRHVDNPHLTAIMFYFISWINPKSDKPKIALQLAPTPYSLFISVYSIKLPLVTVTQTCDLHTYYQLSR